MESQQNVQMAPIVVLAVVTATLGIPALLSLAGGIKLNLRRSHKEQDRFEWKETFDIGHDFVY